MGLGTAEILGLLVLVAGSFVATNLDNLLILVILLGAAPRRRAAVLLGYMGSAVIIVSVATIGVALGTILDPGLVGYLGLVPLSLGLYTLWRQLPGEAGGKTTEREGTVRSSPLAGSELRIGLSSFVLMLSNSGDSLVIFLPLLTESSREALLLIISSYLLIVLAWAGLSLLISANESLARRIEQQGNRLVPWVRIGVGVYILLDTGTDTLL